MAMFNSFLHVYQRVKTAESPWAKWLNHPGIGPDPHRAAVMAHAL